MKPKQIKKIEPELIKSIVLGTGMFRVHEETKRQIIFYDNVDYHDLYISLPIDLNGLMGKLAKTIENFGISIGENNMKNKIKETLELD